MVRYLLLIFAFLVGGVTVGYAQTTIEGKVTDQESGEEQIGANVSLYRGENLITGTTTDFDGNYSISTDPGTYDLVVSYVGYSDSRTEGVVALDGKTVNLDITLSEGVTLTTAVVQGYKVPLIEQDKTSTGGTLTSAQIAKIPSRSVAAIVATTAGATSSDEGGAVSIRGSRSNSTDYYVDGIRVSADLLPPVEDLEQLQVITGGISSRYGDVTGGVISLTTKGPSSTFRGGVDAETSEFLDDYGYNRVSANISGPIIRKKKEDGTKGGAILGFRLSGQYISQKDDDAPATDVYRVTDESLAILEANPMTRFGGGIVPSASLVGNEVVAAQGYRPFEDRTSYNLNAKLDAKLSSAIDVTLTGIYASSTNYFTPSFGSRSQAWRVFNSHNNPFQETERYRGNFRFRHRIGQSDLKSSSADEKKSVIQNAMYTIQFGYEKRNQGVADPRHGENFFNYGYVGQFDFESTPFFGQPINAETWPFPVQHIDFQQTFTGFTPNTEINPVLVNYNNLVEEDGAVFTDYIVRNGFISDISSRVWDIHTNVGQVYDNYNRNEGDIITANINSSFDIVPGGSSENGKHSIQFGILYEQQVERNYTVVPFDLWTTARQLANNHINGVDTSNIVGTQLVGNFVIPVYGALIAPGEDAKFYQSVRQTTGQGLGDWVNVDGLTPDQLSLSDFSAFELTNAGNVGYRGYDYLGNKQEASFDDFWTATDENGVRTLPVGAYRPIYAAAYIQDKFKFKDIIIRMGVRVDQFDANTKVLKDPYAIREIQSAADFHAANGTDQPANIGDDYKVYTVGSGSTVVRAYRDGDDWFTGVGSQVNNASKIFNGELVNPAFVNPDNNIVLSSFDVNSSFEDYKPQLNVMPRVAFSFPISDEANFFAHYDVLVQRPQSNNIATPITYFYFDRQTGIINNPNLKPERTVDYEVGFKQKLNEVSAITISSYYKELRDMIQSRTYLNLPAPYIEYETFDNIDFGTVKGFSVQYDLRRIKNIQLLAAYTLQFADGTGSDAESSRGLSSTTNGFQRVLFPLSYDERHRLNLTVDYRYGRGKNYTGPELFGKKILEDFGVNIITSAVSGRPFTGTKEPAQFDGTQTVGSLNGARLPWNFFVNLRVDKNFQIVKAADGKRGIGMNVSLRVSNLLDRRNIISVYSATGSPTDDGYLATARGAGSIPTGIRAESYLASYQWALLNPNNFSLPRRIFLGARFNF